MRKTPEQFQADLERMLQRRREKNRRYREQHPEYFRLKRREFLERNPGYDKAYAKKWASENRARVNAYRAHQRASRVGRVPPWADFEAIVEVYELAEEFKAAGFAMHVDHIIPLKHPRVCGLHVANNLRPATRSGNSKKGNAFPDYFLGMEQDHTLA